MTKPDHEKHPPSNSTRADSETVEVRNASTVGEACSRWLAKREGRGFKFNGHSKTRRQMLDPGSEHQDLAT